MKKKKKEPNAPAACQDTENFNLMLAKKKGEVGGTSINRCSRFHNNPSDHFWLVFNGNLDATDQSQRTRNRQNNFVMLRTVPLAMRRGNNKFQTANKQKFKINATNSCHLSMTPPRPMWRILRNRNAIKPWFHICWRQNLGIT